MKSRYGESIRTTVAIASQGRERPHHYQTNKTMAHQTHKIGGGSPNMS